MKKTKKIDLALIVGMLIAILFSGVKTFAKDIDDISSQVVRLHILANSDSEEDQSLKLEVRNTVLEEVSILFENCDSRNATEQVIVDNIEYIRDIAQRKVESEGYDYSVDCMLVNMYFDEKEYDNVTMPAGYYDALRITIGNAEGHNWWCVMYPQLCLGPSIEVSSLDNFSEEEIEILKCPKKYKVKFKCAEWYKWLKAKLRW